MRHTRFWQWCAHTFTWDRWRANPFQMYATTFLLLVSTAQMGLGMAPSVPLAQLDSRTQMSLAFCNYVGAAITLYGLHLRALETALWVELSGYLCLVFVLALYVYMLTTHLYLASTTYGFAFSEAFIYAALHRTVQIFLYKRQRRRVLHLRQEIKRTTTPNGGEGNGK